MTPGVNPHASGSGRLHEHVLICPYCWESITMLLDLSVRGQAYIEDCEVCCRPIQVRYETHRGALTRFDAERAQ